MLSSIIAITVRLSLIILVALIAYLFHNLYRMLRKARGLDKPMPRLFLWLSAFSGFFVFMQVFWLIQWLQTFGYIATPLSLEGFGIVGSLINLVLALLIIPVFTASRRLLEGLNLVERFSGELRLIHVNADLLRSIRRRLSAMFGDKSSCNILYALGKEEGLWRLRAFKGVKEGGGVTCHGSVLSREASRSYRVDREGDVGGGQGRKGVLLHPLRLGGG